MMVSRIPTFSIKTAVVRVKPDWILPTLIGVGLFVAALSSAPWHTLLALGVVYLVTLPIGWWSAYRLRRRDEAERAAAQRRRCPRASRRGSSASAAGGEPAPERLRWRRSRASVLDARLRRLIDPPLDRLGAPLAARGLSANAVTVAGFAIGLSAAVAIASRAYLLGLGLLLLNRLCDGLDGAIARRRRPHRSRRLPRHPPRLSDLFRRAVRFRARRPRGQRARRGVPDLQLHGHRLVVPRLRDYGRQARHRDRSARPKSLYYLGGLTEGTETILAFVLACLWPALFSWIALVFGPLCWLTTATRIAVAWQTLR